MKKKAVLALTLAGLVALQLPMTALAETVNDISDRSGAVGIDTIDVQKDGDTEVGIYSGPQKASVEVTAKNITINGSYSRFIEGIRISGPEADISLTAGEIKIINTNVSPTGDQRAVDVCNGHAGTDIDITTGSITVDANTEKVCAVYCKDNEGNLDVKVEGDVTSSNAGLYVRTKGSGTAEVEVSGNVNAGGNAVYAENANILVTVGGNVSSTEGEGITAKNGATVTARSVTNNSSENDTIGVYGGATVHVSGNAANNGDGSYTGSVVTASGAGTKLSVDGSIVQSGELAKTRCYAANVSYGAEVDTGSIVSNCSNGVALYVEKSGTVKVDGNIEGNSAIWVSEINDKTEIAVSGEVKVEEASSTAVMDFGGGSDLSKLELSAWGINGEVADGVDVNYIVRDSDNTASYKNMSFDSSQVQTVEINGKTYYTAKQGTITVTVNSGYELTSTKGITGSGNTYTVVIPEGGYVTLEAILKAIEEEQKAKLTGSEGSAVSGGSWNCGPGGYWTYRNGGIFKDTWGYITLEDGRTGWFWFDKNGVMATGWKEISGKWYYFNEAHDGTYGMMLVNTTTPDGKQVGADGAMIQ